MLGGAVNQHAAVVLGNGGGDLAFQVKMVLSAAAEGTAETMRRPGQRLTRPSAHQFLAGQHEALRSHCARISDGRERGVVNHGADRRAPRLLIALGHHGKQRLT